MQVIWDEIPWMFAFTWIFMRALVHKGTAILYDSNLRACVLWSIDKVSDYQTTKQWVRFGINNSFSSGENFMHEVPVWQIQFDFINVRRGKKNRHWCRRSLASESNCTWDNCMKLLRYWRKLSNLVSRNGKAIILLLVRNSTMSSMFFINIQNKIGKFHLLMITLI